MSRVPAAPRRLLHAPFRGRDAIAAGLLTRHQLSGAQWRRLLPGIYAHAALPLTHLVWCRAAVLAFGDSGVISGRSAVLIWGLDILPRAAPVEITAPRPTELRGPFTVVRGVLPAADVARRRGLPVTTSVRTAFDLARRLPVIEGVVAVDAMCHARLTSVSTIEAYALARPRWPGVGRLRQVLALADPRAESPMETRLRLVLHAGRLPPPAVQHVVRDSTGQVVARLDLAYPGRRLAIEYDGDHHRDRATFVADLERQNALIALGWTVLRFTAADIYRAPGAVVAQVRAVLCR